ncbi:hypothetical protein ACN47E_006563 [Coniothyrium glycines]
MAKKLFTVLENHPEVMNSLANQLGVDTNAVSFYDIYSLTDPELLALVPRPVFALLVIIPLTPTWHKARTAEDEDKAEYKASRYIRSPSTLEAIRTDALPKSIWDRAKVLEESEEFEKAHAEAAKLGDTAAPTPVSDEHTGQHFVAFVKAKDGNLWELEGARKGPLNRGALKSDEDVLSPAALELGLGRLMRIETEQGGDLRFSAIALAPSFT